MGSQSAESVTLEGMARITPASGLKECREQGRPFLASQTIFLTVPWSCSVTFPLLAATHEATRGIRLLKMYRNPWSHPQMAQRANQLAAV